MDFIFLVSADYSFVVDEIVLFAANDGTTNPAHTMLVDYIDVDSDPLTLEDQGSAAADLILNTSVVGNGSIDLDNPGTYDCGDVVQLTAVAGGGETFLSWSGDLTGSTNPISITMNGPRTVTAIFGVNSPPVLTDIPDQSVPQGAPCRHQP